MCRGISSKRWHLFHHYTPWTYRDPFAGRTGAPVKTWFEKHCTRCGKMKVKR